MSFLSSFDISASGMTAERQRLDIASENIANSNTTRTASGEGPYRRKVVVFEAQSGRDSFRMAMANAMGASNRGSEATAGVQVTEIREDDLTDFPLTYDPTHPDANEEGYVQMPNITLVKEIADAMAATQAYSANVTAFNTLKSVIAKGLEIGTR